MNKYEYDTQDSDVTTCAIQEDESSKDAGTEDAKTETRERERAMR
jgi:hypothetical protein